MPPMPANTKKPPQDDPYEPVRFAKKHGIGIEDARRILALHKGDRDSCNRAAHNLSGRN